MKASQVNVVEPRPLTLFNAQERVVSRLSSLPAAALFARTGTGKTAMACEIIKRKGVAHVLWVTPLAPQRDIAESLAAWQPSWVVMRPFLNDEFHGNAAGIDPSVIVTIINYERLDRIGVDYLAQLDMVILDESHRIKSRTTVRYKLCKKLFRKTPHILLMSGTPITKSVADIWAQFNILFRGNWACPRYAEFEASFCVMGGFEGRQVVGTKNAEMLHSIVDPITQYLSLAELVDMPKQVSEYLTVDIDLVALEQAALLEMFPNSVAEFTFRHKWACEHKIDAVCEYLADRLDEPTLIICRYIEEGRQYAARLNVDFLHGGTSAEARERILASRKTCVCQIATICEGVTLVHFRRIVFVSTDFAWGNYEQAKARIFRIGQTRPVLYTHFAANGSVEKLVYKALARKTNVIDEILAGRLHFK